jgi:hypothetical protein
MTKLSKTPAAAVVAATLLAAGCVNVGSIGAIGSNVSGNANSSAGASADAKVNADVKVDASAGQVQQDSGPTPGPTPTPPAPCASCLPSPSPTPTPSPTGTPTPSPASTAKRLTVTSTTPASGASGVDPAGTISLTFNLPVKRADVENSFAVYVAGIPGGGYMLSSNVQLPVSFNAVTDTVVAVNSYTLDASSFTFAWSNNDQTVTATLRPGFRLPADRDPNKGLAYGVSFRGPIRDFSLDPSSTATSGWFGGKDGFHFSVAADTTPPRVLSVTPVDRDGNASGTQDRIRVQFSEPMLLFPSNGMGPVQLPASATAATNASFFKYDAVFAPAGGGPGPTQPATPQNSPTSVVLWDGDPTGSTVVITPVSGVSGNGAGFQAGDTVRVQIGGQLTDPAGNPVEAVPNMTWTGTAQ